MAIQEKTGTIPREETSQREALSHGMANAFEREFGIPLPKCCSQGSCCKGASPSTPYHKLLKRAREGDDFARGFFSIMVPYATHAEAEQVVPGVVERSLKAAKKLDEFDSDADIVFYHCRYQTEDNRCGVWEDRPQFCRDYPDTPFVVMAPGCAFEPWAKSCKDKYFAMKDEVAQLKSLKEELGRLQNLQSQGFSDFSESSSDGKQRQETALEIVKSERPDEPSKNDASPPYSPVDTKIDDLILGITMTDSLSLILSLTGLYVSSPLKSVYFLY